VLGYWPFRILEGITMGKGDRKTAKGKRNISSYGNARPNAALNKVVAKSAPTAAKPKAAAPVRKAPAKKIAAR
jgi:30S ribosomal protein S31